MNLQKWTETVYMTYLFLFRFFLNTSIKNLNTISSKTFPINLESKPYVNLNKCIDRCSKRHRININFDECREMKIFSIKYVHSTST